MSTVMYTIDTVHIILYMFMEGMNGQTKSKKIMQLLKYCRNCNSKFLHSLVEFHICQGNARLTTLIIFDNHALFSTVPFRCSTIHEERLFYVYLPTFKSWVNILALLLFLLCNILFLYRASNAIEKSLLAGATTHVNS